MKRRPVIEPIAAPTASHDPAEPWDEEQAPRLPALRSPAARPLPDAPCAATASPPHDAESPLDGASAFAAQMMGQGGRKRGLKGGPPVLQAAKSAYLEAEYSGPNDRRARLGRITKTEI